MTGNAYTSTYVQGDLQVDEGRGVVRIEARLNDVAIADVWTALTDPEQLAGWYGEIEGDLRAGGEYRARLFASGWEGTGTVDVCEPGRRLTVSGQEPDDPEKQSIEVTLAADGGQVTMVVEQRGLPLEYLAAYGAGMQIHVEDLAAHLAGRGRCDAGARFGELRPGYDSLAADFE
jgi:uncharacterized protein YndB with AHSA1/START domain